MRFIVYGAGAIGGAIGARLLQHGHDVVLVARGPHLDALRAGGLVLESPHESVTLPVAAVGHPSEIRFQPDDVVLLTVKSQHTLGALEDLRAVAGDTIPVVCAQNGVANERMALRRFARVYGMLVFLPATHLEPGAVQLHARRVGGILDAGAYPAGSDPLIAEITAALQASGFSARPDPAVMRLKYAKLLANLNNALAAACELGSESADVSEQLRKEGLACYDAAGIDCASAAEFRERRGNLIELAPVRSGQRFGGSSWQSLARGAGSIEADYLNGEVVLLGRLHGVPTPANRVLQQLANELARAGAKPGSVPLADVRERIARATRA